MEEKEINSVDDLVLIHLTNYPPKGGVIRTPKSAGAMHIEEYNGIKYEKKRERDTIHFTINGEVEPNTGGSFQGRKYAIIIPGENAKEIEGFKGTPVDLYRIGNIKIPKGSYILCLEGNGEALQQEVGEGITVIEEPGDCINGKANELIEKLGYKKQGIGFWGWANDKDNAIARRIMDENGWEQIQHTSSKEMQDELTYEDINRTVEIIKLIKNEKISISNKLEDTILSMNKPITVTASLNMFDDNKYLDTFCKKMQEIGIPIPDSVIKESQSIKEGTISDELKEEKKSEYLRSGWENVFLNDEKLAQGILRRRVVGELRLNQIKQEFGENSEIKFEDLLEVFDDALYEYTTEERRTEFLEFLGIELSDVEMRILKNEELKNIYLEIEGIKDVPYKDLSEEEQRKFREFQRFYDKSFDEIKLDRENNYDENGNIINANGMIAKKQGFSQEEIDMLQGKCKDNRGNIVLVLNNVVWDENMTLTQCAENYEKMVTEVNEILNPRTVSTEELGRQTLAKQNNTREKLGMEQILAQKMKEYTISREEGVMK